MKCGYQPHPPHFTPQPDCEVEASCSLATVLQVKDLAPLDLPALLWTSDLEAQITACLVQHLSVPVLTASDAPKVQVIFTELVDVAANTVSKLKGRNGQTYHNEQTWLTSLRLRCPAFRDVDNFIVKAILKALVRRRRKHLSDDPSDSKGTTPLGRAVQGYIMARKERAALVMMSGMSIDRLSTKRRAVDSDDEDFEEVAPPAKKTKTRATSLPVPVNPVGTPRRSPRHVVQLATPPAEPKTPVSAEAPEALEAPEVDMMCNDDEFIRADSKKPTLSAWLDDSGDKPASSGRKSYNFFALNSQEQSSALTMLTRSPPTATREDLLSLPPPMLRLLQRAAVTMRTLMTRDTGKNAEKTSSKWEAAYTYLQWDETVDSRDGVPEGWSSDDWMYWVFAHLHMFVLE